MHKERTLALVEHIPIRWGDMDAMGHVNNTVYFRYMEQVRVSWFGRLFGELSSTTAEGMVIVNASCNFLLPLTYPGTVEVTMYLGAARRSSVESSYELKKDGVLYADGAAKIIWIDMQHRKSRPLPDAIRALCPPTHP